MVKVIVALSLMVVLVGCGVPPGSSAGQASSEASPPGLELVEWDRAAATPSELCPEDAEAVDAPVFGAAVDAQEGIVRHGIVANSQGELFRIDVTGVADGPVETYLSDVMLCLDVLVVEGGQAAVENGPTPDEEEPSEETFGGEDLIIEVDVLGFVDPDARERAAEIGNRPVDEWASALADLPGFAPPGDDVREYLIDAVVDPLIGLATHHYRERWLTKVFAKVSVLDSGGQVRAGLCRNSYFPFAKVTVNEGTTGPALSDDATPYSVRYDLGLKGLTSSNRYRVAMSWNVPGWRADYWDPAPTGSLRPCYP